MSISNENNLTVAAFVANNSVDERVYHDMHEFYALLERMCECNIDILTTYNEKNDIHPGSASHDIMVRFYNFIQEHELFDGGSLPEPLASGTAVLVKASEIHIHNQSNVSPGMLPHNMVTNGVDGRSIWLSAEYVAQYKHGHVVVLTPYIHPGSQPPVPQVNPSFYMVSVVIEAPEPEKMELSSHQLLCLINAGFLPAMEGPNEPTKPLSSM